jgi:hypothetical protein
MKLGITFSLEAVQRKYRVTMSRFRKLEDQKNTRGLSGKGYNFRTM